MLPHPSPVDRASAAGFILAIAVPSRWRNVARTLTST